MQGPMGGVRGKIGPPSILRLASVPGTAGANEGENLYATGR